MDYWAVIYRRKKSPNIAHTSSKENGPKPFSQKPYFKLDGLLINKKKKGILFY